MEAFDRWALSALNRYAGRWPELDGAVLQLVFNDLTKGGLFVAVLVALVARAGPDRSRRVVHGIALLGVTLAVLAANRVLALLLPFRLRPLKDPTLGLVLPSGLWRDAFSNLSSFPSDHAVLFVALSLGTLALSRWVGGLLVLWTCVGVLLPRVYVGLHWPTDVLAGALIGGAAAGLAGVWARHPWALARVVRWGCLHPGLVAAPVVLTLFGFATLFDPFVEWVRLMDAWSRN